jgi:hypothetical protein
MQPLWKEERSWPAPSKRARGWRLDHPTFNRCSLKPPLWLFTDTLPTTFHLPFHLPASSPLQVQAADVSAKCTMLSLLGPESEVVLKELTKGSTEVRTYVQACSYI